MFGDDIPLNFIKVKNKKIEEKRIPWISGGYIIVFTIIIVRLLSLKIDFKFLEKKEENTVPENEKRKSRRRMYEIVITYKEFLKNPETFKRFIENPHIIDKWNFWCKERMYKQECFQKRDK